MDSKVKMRKYLCQNAFIRYIQKRKEHNIWNLQVHIRKKCFPTRILKKLPWWGGMGLG
ncbi:hypothetical protein HanRHA438_Chr16g0784521 [Helianthus annuus]|nr:hypothetical protein HanRHA438_Chr16g0784521 [Helianthus annuus]